MFLIWTNYVVTSRRDVTGMKLNAWGIIPRWPNNNSSF